jgi:hypothetical protein
MGKKDVEGLNEQIINWKKFIGNLNSLFIFPSSSSSFRFFFLHSANYPWLAFNCPLVLRKAMRFFLAFPIVQHSPPPPTIASFFNFVCLRARLRVPSLLANRLL